MRSWPLLTFGLLCVTADAAPLSTAFGFQYPYFMVIDGNDDRGIDVGIASRFPIPLAA